MTTQADEPSIAADADVDVQAAVSEGSVESTAPETEAEKPAPAEASPTDWAERRIHRLAEQKATARAEADYLERQTAELKARLAKYETPTEAPAEKPVDPYVLAEQIAARRIQQETFGRAADALVAKGHDAYTPAEFDGAVRRLQGLGAIFADGGEPSDVLSAVLECDAPHEVLFHLGAHPDVAEDMVAMSPRALIRAMAKLEAKLVAAPAKPVSKAPAPVRPVSGTGRSSEPISDRDDISTWMRKREKQLQARR